MQLKQRTWGVSRAAWKLLKDTKKRGKLLLNRLGAGDYHAVLADELVHGAVVNQNQAGGGGRPQRGHAKRRQAQKEACQK